MSAQLNIQEIIATSEEQTTFEISPFPSTKSQLLIHIDGVLVSFNHYSLNAELYQVILDSTANANVHIGSIVSFATILNTAEISDTTSEDSEIYENGIVGSQIKSRTITHLHLALGTINAKNINVLDDAYGLVTKIIAGDGIKVTSPSGVPTGNGSCIIESTVGADVSGLQDDVNAISLDYTYLNNDVRTNNNVVFNGTKTYTNKITFQGGIELDGSKEEGQFYKGVVAPTGTELLNFDGFFRATKVYNAVFNDIAECMPSDGSLKPGDFAMIDLKSSTFRLTRYIHNIENMKLFMGIISIEPGMIVGDNPNYKFPVYLVLKGMVDIPFSVISQSFNIESFSIGDDLLIARDRSYQKIIGKILEINNTNQYVKVFV